MHNKQIFSVFVCYFLITIRANILDNIFSQTLSPTVINFQQSLHMSQSITAPDQQKYTISLDLNVQLGAITIEVSRRFGFGFISFDAPVAQIQIIPDHKNGSVSVPLGGICNNYQLVSAGQLPMNDTDGKGHIQTKNKEQKDQLTENLSKQPKTQKQIKEKPTSIKQICVQEFEKWKSVPIEQCIRKQQIKKQQRELAKKAEKIGFGDFLYFAFKFVNKTREGYAVQQLRLDLYSDTTQRIKEIQEIRGRGKQFQKLEQSLRPAFVLGNDGKIIKAYESKQMHKPLDFQTNSNIEQYKVCEGQVQKISQQGLSNIWKDVLKDQFSKRYDEDEIPQKFRRIIDFNDNQ